MKAEIYLTFCVISETLDIPESTTQHCRAPLPSTALYPQRELFSTLCHLAQLLRLRSLTTRLRRLLNARSHPMAKRDGRTPNAVLKPPLVLIRNPTLAPLHLFFRPEATSGKLVAAFRHIEHKIAPQ